MKPIRWTLLIAVLFCTINITGEGLAKDDFPKGPITVVCWSPGAMGETVTRAICAGLEKELGQPVVVDLKPGAGGAIAINHVVKSKPDGYTLGMAVTSNFVINPHVRKVSYDTLTDIVDICAICKFNFGLVVRSDSPWKSYEEVIAYARNNPGKFTYATAGVGVTQHICMERIAMKEGIKWTHVPFKSGGPAVLACLGGHTDAAVQGSVDVVPHVKTGKLRLLLSVDGDRWPDAPDVPQILEKGYDFTAASYISYMAPKGLPEAIRQKVEDGFRKAMDHPSFAEVMKTYNIKATFMNGKDYSTLWRSDFDSMGKVVKTLGLHEE
jgi:tripartite-type tricarboxylate transporter receptor subunit TctC